MKPYGLPRHLDVEQPDVADIQQYGRKTAIGGRERGYQRSAKKAAARRYWKRKARADAKEFIDDVQDEQQVDETTIKLTLKQLQHLVNEAFGHESHRKLMRVRYEILSALQDPSVESEWSVDDLAAFAAEQAGISYDDPEFGEVVSMAKSYSYLGKAKHANDLHEAKLGYQGLLDTYMDAVDGLTSVDEMLMHWANAGASAQELEDLARDARDAMRMGVARRAMRLGVANVDPRPPDYVLDLAHQLGKGLSEALNDHEYAVGGNTFDIDVLMDLYPDAYEGLPETYKADPDALEFYVDEDNYVRAIYAGDPSVPESYWEPDVQEWWLVDRSQSV